MSTTRINVNLAGQYEEKNQDFEPIYVESEVTMEDERIGNVTGEKVASLRFFFWMHL